MSREQAHEFLSWGLPNISTAILFFIPAHDPNTILMYVGYASKALSFLGAMTVNIFAVRHYYLANKRKKQK